VTEKPEFIYATIKEQLQKKIEDGSYATGSLMPTEKIFQEQFSVSRQTIRKVLAQLSEEGYIVSKRGSGSRVLSPRISTNAHFLSTFAEQMEEHGLPHSAKVISASIRQVPGKFKGYFNDAENEIFEIVRLRLSNYLPLVVRKSYIPVSIYPDLLKEDIENRALYDILKEEAGVLPYQAKQKFYAANASPNEAALLGIESGAALLVWEGCVYDKENRLIEAVEAYYRGDSFEFQLEQTKSWTASDHVQAPKEWFRS
jgi:GntR family transcriptional regulator